MSYENALKTVNFLLEVLEEAEKPAPVDSTAKPSSAAQSASDEKEDYFQSVEDGVKEGMTCRVTNSSKRLDECWAEAELGTNDEKDMYLGVIGKVMEIEEDDDTVQLRWANLDTCWMPIKACIDAKGAEPTLPSGMISHLDH